MLDTSRHILLHGSKSDSNIGKAREFREKNWTIIGSSST